MSKPSNETAVLDDFLRAELAGIDLDGVRLEAIPPIYWQSALQSRLRRIADFGADEPSFPAANDAVLRPRRVQQGETPQ